MMQTDVKSVEIDASGLVLNGTTRIKGVYVAGGATAGSIDLIDSTTSSGSIALTLDTVVGNAAYVLLPGEGIKVNNGIYATFNGGAAGVTVFYG